jgi:hypothetical protein
LQSAQNKTALLTPSFPWLLPGIQSQVLASSDKYLVLQITVPAISLPGNYSCAVGSSKASDVYAPELSLAAFAVAVADARPSILLASPSRANAKGGDRVLLQVAGFPSPFDRAAVSVYFGATAVPLVGDPAADGGGGASFSVLAPAGDGLTSVRVMYEFSNNAGSGGPAATLIAALPFLFFSDLVRCTCVGR